MIFFGQASLQHAILRFMAHYQAERDHQGLENRLVEPGPILAPSQEVQPGRFEVVAVTRSVTELKGMFGKAGKTVSIEDMNRTIAARGASAR